MGTNSDRNIGGPGYDAVISAYRNVEELMGGQKYDAPSLNTDVAVGELGTMEKGSGARKNSGKPQLDLIPMHIWRSIWSKRGGDLSLEEEALIDCLCRWQGGETPALSEFLSIFALSFFLGRTKKA